MNGHDDAAARIREEMAWLRGPGQRGVPDLPAGSTIAADLGPLLDEKERLLAERKRIGTEVAGLQAERKRAERGNVTATATALRTGEAADLRSLPDIDAQIAALRLQAEAIPVALDANRRAIEQLVRQKATAYTSELVASRRVDREAFLAVLDQWETAWTTLVNDDATIDWIARGGVGDVARPLPKLESLRGVTLSQLLVALRAIVVDAPEPRPTVDAEGVSMTGWNAWGQLANGKRAIGNRDRRGATRPAEPLP